MSRADIETLRAAYEAISRGHFPDVHPDFELKTPDRGIAPRTYRGPEEASRAFEDFFEPFEEAVAGHLWTMRDGKPARLEIFPEREKALEAAGIKE